MQADLEGGTQWKHANKFKFSDTNEGEKLPQILEIKAQVVMSQNMLGYDSILH